METISKVKLDRPLAALPTEWLQLPLLAIVITFFEEVNPQSRQILASQGF